MKSVFCILCLLALVTGCASPNYNYSPELVDVSEPPIESTNVAYVGDQMLRQGKFGEHEAVFLKRQTSVGTISNYTFSPGYYAKQGQSEDGKSGFYLPSPYGNSGSVTKSAITDPFQVMQVYYDEQRICGVSTFNGKVCTQETEYEFTKQITTSSNSFQQTLIYSGRIGERINLGYREFSGSMARPAFNNDVQYDLSESRVIGYKGARIEIIEANNELIRYRVISNFNGAEW